MKILKDVLLLSTICISISCSQAQKSEKEADLELDPDSKTPSLAKETANDLPAVKVEPTQLAQPGSRLDQKYTQLQSAFKLRDEKLVREESAKILAKNPQDVVALNALAVSAIMRGQTRAARYYLESASRFHKDEPALFNNLAVIEWKEGRLDEAILYLKKSYRISAKHPETLANLGMIYAKYGEAQKAVTLLSEAYSRNKSAMVGSHLALAHTMKGDFKQAESLYESLVKSDTKDTNMLINYSLLLVDRLNKIKEAVPFVNRLSFLGSDDSYTQERIRYLERKVQGGS